MLHGLGHLLDPHLVAGLGHLFERPLSDVLKVSGPVLERLVVAEDLGQLHFLFDGLNLSFPLLGSLFLLSKHVGSPVGWQLDDLASFGW